MPQRLLSVHIEFAMQGRKPPSKQQKSGRLIHRAGVAREKPSGLRMPVPPSRPQFKSHTPMSITAPVKNLCVLEPGVRGTNPRQLPTPACQGGPKLTQPSTKHFTRIATQTGIQRSTSRVVQAVKFFPNLHPGAVESINPGNVFRLNSFSDQYRLHRVNTHSVNVPNQQYNFVRTRQGEMLLHNRYRHPSIAEGKQVLYAGEIFFNNGKLQWWSNGSGHYQPSADDAQQANLPMDYFYSYQQIIKGEHMRKRAKS